MASPAQILANRENARQSSGPKTDTGKQTSSRNAIRQGLTSTQIVIPGEDQSAYEELLRGMHQSYAPVNAAERVLVDQIAANACAIYLEPVTLEQRRVLADAWEVPRILENVAPAFKGNSRCVQKALDISFPAKFGYKAPPCPKR